CRALLILFRTSSTQSSRANPPDIIALASETLAMEQNAREGAQGSPAHNRSASPRSATRRVAQWAASASFPLTRLDPATARDPESVTRPTGTFWLGPPGIAGCR